MMASSTWAMLAVQGCLLQTWVITEQLKFQEGSGVVVQPFPLKSDLRLKVRDAFLGI